jgi:hypothetical protein
MSVESLMVHEVTLLTQTGISQSSTGEGTRVFDEGVATVMYLEPVKGSEAEADRNTPIGDWVGYAKADEAITSTSRILYDSHTFDVVGPPEKKPNPRLDTISHIQLDLQEIDTVEGVDATATPDVVGGEGGV